jgi:hypothetical protein
MSSIAAALLDCLRSVERPGDFCVGGMREVFMPAVDVDGVGRIAFPLLPTQAERLLAIAEPAPYGRGEETVLDRDVRRTWQIDSRRVRIGGRHWEKTLAELVADAARNLGVSPSLGLAPRRLGRASSSISSLRRAGSMPGLRRARSSTCWPGPRRTTRTMSWCRPLWSLPSRRRARLGQRFGGFGKLLLPICAPGSRCLWKRHETGPVPIPSSAHAPTAASWARSCSIPISSSGA